MKKVPMPEHMDRESRSQRLYDTLKNMGLFVSPIFVGGEMDSFHVAVDLPRFAPKPSAEAGVVVPVQGAEVGGAVTSTENRRTNVVDFPPVV